MGNRKIVTLGLYTIIGFPLAAFIINYFFSSESFWDIFISKQGILKELIIGMCLGILSGLFAWLIIQLKILQPVREKYQNVIGSLRMNIGTIVIVSICAGVGEEILFRGILQSYFGIWVTAVGFVAIHGYLNPFDWRISIYGAYMTAAIIAIGYLNQLYGLTSAMLAHTIIDIILFVKLSREYPNNRLLAKKNPLSEHSQSPLQTTD
ncbi:MAG: CPBP family intramembrane metalloprotease [Flavobacteriales bacterium]|nr:CPBP family intramembrane metalloprotease [Flavobacteriales bacterium]